MTLGHWFESTQVEGRPRAHPFGEGKGRKRGSCLSTVLGVELLSRFGIEGGQSGSQIPMKDLVGLTATAVSFVRWEALAYSNRNR